ncbi:DEAD/DEAH box helicase [Aliamphritea spongicola]|nr:DEAD/DEAH box helicase [Aliamphritea spongicola]
MVYIVPTRALITEVSSRLRSLLRDKGLSDVLVRTAPFPSNEEQLQSGSVFVFTQERLMSFLNSHEDNEPYISSLIVDEAHEIQKGKRGILLQSVIDYSLKMFPAINILFASPLIKNPNYFLNVFNLNEEGKYFTEIISPVSQNIFLLNSVRMKPKFINVDLLTDTSSINIGKYRLISLIENRKLRGALMLQKLYRKI